MYYCEKCRVKNEWPDAFVRSSGKCECCGESAVCWDRPSSSLPRVVRPVANNVAAQAGDEPMRQALQVCVKALEFRKERSANDEFALNLARIALSGSPRATADVERGACKWAYEEGSEAWASGCGELWSFIDAGPEENRVKFCQGCGKPVALDAAIATTKPGA